MNLTRAIKIRMLQLIWFLSLIGPLTISSAMARSIDEDRPAVEAMLKDPRLKSVFENAKQGQWKSYSKENGGWGGGHSVRRHPGDRPILLDFFTFDANFQDSGHSHDPLLETDMMKFIGMESIKVQELPAYGLARKLLIAWRPDNQGLVDMILLALDNLSINYVWRGVPLAKSETYFLPQQLRQQFPRGVLTPCVAYHEKFGLMISATEWNQMGDLSQAGLLIHESLRRIQLSYGLSVSQEKLQLLTATIALKSTNEKIELESREFLDQKLLQEIRRVSTWKIAPSAAQENLCQRKTLNFENPKPSLMIWDEPKGIIESFCQVIPKIKTYGESEFPENFSLHANVSEFYLNTCEKSSGSKADFSMLALKSWLYLKLQVDDLVERTRSSRLPSRSSYAYSQSEITDFGQEAFFYKNSFAKIFSNSLTPAIAAQEWQSWRQENCGSALSETALLKAIRLLFLSGSENSALVEEAAEAYTSQFVNSPKQSQPQLIEKLITQRREEEAAKNHYKDTLWEKIVGMHVGGKTLTPEFLRIVQGLRATEEYLRRNLPIERLNF